MAISLSSKKFQKNPSNFSQMQETQHVARKTFVIDTNILLHDPDAIKRFKNSDVLLPLGILEELDAMKRLSDEVGKNARNVMRFISALQINGDLQSGVEIENGIRVRVHIDVKAAEKKSFPLPLDRNAHRLLMIAFHLKEMGEQVVVVSKDFVIRVKAEAIGLEAEDYENLKFSYDKLYKGYQKLEVPKREIDMFYKDGFLVKEGPFFPNEYVVLSCVEQSSAVTKYNHVTKRLEPLLKINRDIWGIQPLNVEQKCALDLLLRDDIQLVTLVGPAGTGKTMMALAAGLRKVFDESVYTKILVSRPIIPLGKDIGYLPGTKEEKLSHWMQPIFDNLEFLCQSTTGSSGGSEAQQWIMDSKKLEMEAVTYIRGRSLPKMYIIIDEAQNLTQHEVKTIISRAGKNTKVILTGDPTQIDNPYLDKDSNALTYVVGKMKEFPVYGHVMLERTERSELAAIAADIM